MAEDLRRFGAGDPIRARPVGRLEWTIKWARRRPTAAALFAAILLLVVGGSGATVWYVGDRADRRLQEALRGQQINREANAALDEADSHLQEMRARLADPLKAAELLSDIDLWQRTVAKGRQAWQRAQSACDENDPLVAQSALSRLRTVKKTLMNEENGYRLGKELDDIKSEALTAIDGKVQVERAKPRYAAFLAGQGLDVDRDDKALVIAALRNSPICLALVATLDHWAEITALGNPNDQQLVRLLELTRAADPDPWRDRFRDRDVWQDRAALVRLAKDADGEKQSPTILAALGSRLAQTGENTASFYHRALLSHPRDYWLHWNAAHLAKEPAERVGLYLATLAIRQKSAAAYNNFGDALRMQKDLPGAIAALNKALELDPKYTPAYINLGVVLREQKDLPGAIAAYKKALELNPNHAFAYNNFGDALQLRKDLPGATAAFNKAIELDPKYVLAYNNLGNALRMQKNLPGAIVALNKAIELDPKYTPAYINLGVVLREQQDLPGAIAAYKKVIELDPKYAFAYNNLGVALQLRKDLPGAIAAFNKAIELDRRRPPGPGWTSGSQVSWNKRTCP